MDRSIGFVVFSGRRDDVSENQLTVDEVVEVDVS